MAHQRTDIELLKGFTEQSDIEAFEELVHRYSHRVFKLAFGITKNEADAEDVSQDVFIQLYSKGVSFDYKSKFSSWLYRVAANASLMKRRYIERRPQAYFEDMPDAACENIAGARSDEYDVNVMSTRHEIREVIEGALDSLPAGYRAMFLLRDIDGLSIKDAANALNVPESQSKNWVFRARTLVRQRVGEYINS